MSLLRSDRRGFLRSMGACIALPSLPSLAGASSWSHENHPRRMAFIYHPNGVNVDRWHLGDTSDGFTLSPSLSPLENVKSHLQVFRGFEQANAWAGPDGAGDHARANATFLTCARARKTGGADIHVGTSVDQVAAHAIGSATRFPSLELSCDTVRNSGECDSGYSCAYQFNLAWRDPHSPMTPEVNPRLVFERFFGGRKDSVDAERRALHKSVLDYVTDDAQRLRRQLGTTDQHTLGEYLETVRSIEQRIERAESFGIPRVSMHAPAGIPSDYGDHLRLMYDLMALAFQTDSTRVATFLTAHDGSNRTFDGIGVPHGHHNISHHDSDPEKLEMIAKIDEYYVAQFAYFLERLRDIPEGESTLLDNTMIVYGGCISDPNRHRHDDLPVLLAGGGGGTLRTGRHVKFANGVPLGNLYLALLERMHVPVDRLGDSTEVLQNV